MKFVSEYLKESNTKNIDSKTSSISKVADNSMKGMIETINLNSKNDDNDPVHAEIYKMFKDSFYKNGYGASIGSKQLSVFIENEQKTGMNNRITIDTFDGKIIDIKLSSGSIVDIKKMSNYFNNVEKEITNILSSIVNFIMSKNKK